MRGEITQEEAVDYLLWAWSGLERWETPIPASTPTPRSTPTPYPTPTVTPSPIPTPTLRPIPTSTPAPMLPSAPSISFYRINSGSFQVNWRDPKSSDPPVTGYEIWHRPANGPWTTVPIIRAGIRGTSRAGIFTVGTQYDIQIRALSANGPSAWSRIAATVPPRPTPVPPTPTPTPAPTPTPTPCGLVRDSNGEISSSDQSFWFGQDKGRYKSATRSITVINPDTAEWVYGFKVRAIKDAFNVMVSDDGKWKVEILDSITGSVVAEYSDPVHNDIVELDPAEQNTLKLFSPRYAYGHPYRFYINSVHILNIPPHSEADDYSQRRSHYFDVFSDSTTIRYQEARLCS